MDENTIPIKRPQSHVPDVVKQALERDANLTQKTAIADVPHESYSDIPEQFIERIKYPTEIIDLPSKGWFYPANHPLSSGKIEIKMMTAREEDILTSTNLVKKGIVLQRLLESLIVNKKIKQEEILLCDMNGIFVAVRRLAYGDKYGPLKITCPSCGEDCQHTVDLSLIEPKPFDFEKYPRGINNFTATLPYCKKMICYKILNQKEDDMVDGEVKAMSKVNKDRSTAITTRLKYVIQSVDGNCEIVDIRKFIETELLSRDNLYLRTHIKDNIPDLDMRFQFVCPNCDHADKLEVPMTVEFFWPKS